MRIVFFGSPDYAVPSMRAVASAGADLRLVVTQPDRPAGRKMHLQPPPVKSAAIELGIPVIQPESPNDPGVIERIRAVEPDVFCVISYGELLGKRLLAVPRLYPLNAHGSLLPRHRGASPIQGAIRSGDAETGVTIMRMVRKLDAGDIGLTLRIPVAADETSITLHDKLACLSATAFVKAITLADAGALFFSAQDESQATYTRKLTRDDGVMDFTRPAVDLERMVRAYTPWPSATANLTLNGKPTALKVLRATLVSTDEKTDVKNAGEILAADDARGLIVACGSGALRLNEVQLPGRNRCSDVSFIRGLRG